LFFFNAAAETATVVVIVVICPCRPLVVTVAITGDIQLFPY